MACQSPAPREPRCRAPAKPRMAPNPMRFLRKVLGRVSPA